MIRIKNVFGRQKRYELAFVYVFLWAPQVERQRKLNFSKPRNKNKAKHYKPHKRAPHTLNCTLTVKSNVFARFPGMGSLL